MLTCQRLNQTLRGVNLEPHQKVRQFGQVGMRKGVISQFVTLAGDTSHNAWMLERLKPCDEECRFDVLLLENVKNLLRVIGIGAVVKSDDHRFRRDAAYSDFPGTGKYLIVFIFDFSGIINR